MNRQDKDVAYRTRVNGIDVAVDMDGDYIVETRHFPIAQTRDPSVQNFPWVLMKDKEAILEILDNPETINFDSKDYSGDLGSLAEILKCVR